MVRKKKVKIDPIPDSETQGHNSSSKKINQDNITEGEAKYRLALERVSDAFVALDVNWCYTYVNSKAENLFNKSPGYLIGKNIWEEFPNSVNQPFYKVCQRAMSSQQYQNIEQYYDSNDLWFENHIYPSPTGLSIYLRDITERKKAQEAANKNEKRFKAMVENNDTIISLLDANFNTFYRSPSSERITGWTDEESKQIGSINLVHPDDQEMLKNLMVEILNKPGKLIPITIRAKHKNGGYISLEGTVINLLQDENVKAIVSNTRDVTDQKKAESQLVKEKELANSVINSLPGIFYLYDSNGKFLRWNKNFETVSGYNAREIAKMHPLDFFDEDEKELLTKRIEGVFEKGFGDVEANFFSKDKKKIPYYFNGWRIEYENQTCLTGVGIDIAKRKKVESLLQYANERTTSILNLVGYPIFLKDNEHRIISANPSFLDLFGLAENDVIGKTLAEHVPENERKHFLKVDRMVLDTGIPDIREEELTLNDFTRTIVTEKKRLIDGLGNRFLVGTIRDITNWKQAEEKLQNSENKLRAFFRSTPDSSVLLGENFKILAFNSSANELNISTHGNELNEGDDYLKLILPERRSTILEFLQKALNGEINKKEFLIKNISNGSKEWWKMTYMPAYDKEGNILGVVVNSTKIDKIKKAEIKLKKQFGELQKTNKELDRFVYSVSHDLRAPLASILGLVNVAELENPSESFSNYLFKIRSSVERLDGFIKDILDYSRNSRINTQIEKINFNQLINEIQNNFKLIEGADRLKIELVIDAATAFYSDRGRIEILFNNLFSNAIKYQDFQKESSYVHILIAVSDKKADIKFSDNGIGIEKKQLDKIFNMFYKASHNSQGSGLGLYIAKETIDKLKGTIKVDSQYGSSTTFEITIPNSQLK